MREKAKCLGQFVFFPDRLSAASPPATKTRVWG
jgi:hypothetical protein